MSRNQQGKVFGQSDYNSQNLQAESQTGFNTTQNDINDFHSAINAFKAQNPYVEGGEFETAANQELAGTAAGGGQALSQTLQGQSVRTGQNAGGAIAAGKEVAAENQRRLAGEEAGATEARLGGETAYNEAGLKATGEIPGMEDKLAEEEGGLGLGYMNTAQKAGETPSFWDTLGESFGGAFGGAFGKGLGQWTEQELTGSGSSGGSGGDQNG